MSCGPASGLPQTDGGEAAPHIEGKGVRGRAPQTEVGDGPRQTWGQAPRQTGWGRLPRDRLPRQMGD